MEWQTKRILVIGKGKSGCAVARQTSRRGAKVYVYDDRDFAPCSWPQVEMGNLPDILPLDFAVASPAVDSDHLLYGWLRHKGIPVLSEPDVGRLLADCHTIAITGTNGKTTTVRMVTKLLVCAGYMAQAVGNIGVPFCDTTMGAGEYAVVEMSSYQLEQSRLFWCDYAAITNLAPDHLERHGSMQQYVECKRKLLDMARNGYASNVDDPTLPMVDKPCYAYSMDAEWSTAFVKDGHICLRTREGVKQILPISRFPLLGKHNLYNALCALSLAYAAVGYSPMYGAALCDFVPDDMRLQRIEKGKRIAYNDSKSTNISSTLAAIDAMRRPVVLLLGGYDKGEDYVPFFANLSPMVARTVLFGAAAFRIASCADQAGYSRFCRVDTLAQAVKEALNGDEVLLFSPSCSSFDCYSSYVERGHDFENAFLAFAR